MPRPLPRCSNVGPGHRARAVGAGTSEAPTAAIGRGVAGHVGRRFVVNLPGLRGGSRTGWAVLDPLIDHISAQLEASTATGRPLGDPLR
ncbi:hypothetical protein QJS66_20225 [Kocuria rhizophila]|nr:hypothetical protein QJS66_20225 [Kocuria rhizophila]